MRWLQSLFGNLYDWQGQLAPGQLYQVPVADLVHPTERRFMDPRKLLRPADLPTEITAQTPYALTQWMRMNFRYASDQSQFHADDVWQPPGDLLKNKQGDCEDWAIFLCSYFLRNGYRSRVCLGTQQVSGPHAWVLVYLADEAHLFDPTWNYGDWSKAKWMRGYVPAWSVDQHDFRVHGRRR